MALYFVALAWLLLLPYDQYNKKTYMSENALLPAQVYKVECDAAVKFLYCPYYLTL